MKSHSCFNLNKFTWNEVKQNEKANPAATLIWFQGYQSGLHIMWVLPAEAWMGLKFGEPHISLSSLSFSSQWLCSKRGFFPPLFPLPAHSRFFGNFLFSVYYYVNFWRWPGQVNTKIYNHTEQFIQDNDSQHFVFHVLEHIKIFLNSTHQHSIYSNYILALFRFEATDFSAFLPCLQLKHLWKKTVHPFVMLILITDRYWLWMDAHLLFRVFSFLPGLYICVHTYVYTCNYICLCA